MDENDKPVEGSKSAPSRKTGRTKKTGSEMSVYIRRYIPEGAVIDFIFNEDFDGDGMKEAVVGFTEFLPFPPESSILYLDQNNENYKHFELLTNEDSQIDFQSFGIFDNAFAVDTNGDGVSELLVSLAAGNGHNTTLFIFSFITGEPQLIWRYEEGFYHGSVEVSDIDEDGIYEIIVESGTKEGNEILELNEACYHVRESSFFKWNGKNYINYPNRVRMPYLSYNTAVAFLAGLWKQEYRQIYNMVVMPGFIGLDGLDDSSSSAFRRFIEKNIRPVLQRNLLKGKLMPAEPYDTYCLFNGVEDDFTVELSKDKGLIKVQCLNIYKKPQI